MKAAAIENELKGTLGDRGGKNVQGGEAATQSPTIQLRGNSLDREGGEIDA